MKTIMSLFSLVAGLFLVTATNLVASDLGTSGVTVAADTQTAGCGDPIKYEW